MVSGYGRPCRGDAGDVPSVILGFSPMRELISEINRELTFGTSPTLDELGGARPGQAETSAPRRGGKDAPPNLSELSDTEIETMLPEHGLGELPGLESEWARRCWLKKHAKDKQLTAAHAAQRRKP